MTNYLIGGIVLECPFDMPELVKTNNKADYSVKVTTESLSILSPTFTSTILDTDHQTVLVKIPDVARFLIVNSSVRIQLEAENRFEDARKYLMTMVFGTISYFGQKFFPLHGGGVVVDGEAYLFTGPSGAGKSTITTRLAELGYSVIGDDISNLFIENERVMVHPCYPRTKLWEESFDLLDADTNNKELLRSDYRKFMIDLPNFQTQAVPVKTIFILEQGEGAVEFTEITGVDQIFRLKENSYKPWMVNALKIQLTHFQQLSAIVENVNLVSLNRKKDKGQFENGLQEIINYIKK